MLSVASIFPWFLVALVIFRSVGVSSIPLRAGAKAGG
jgi:hypothetical protein